jgi:sigma-70-like protein
VNRERAEAHLRLLAEEELRRVTTLASDGTAGSPPEGAASGTETPAVTATVMPAGSGWSADHAVTELYSVHHQALLRLAALLVRDAQIAEEVVQESFVAMHDSWPRLRNTGAALAYLRQTVVNRSRSVLRHRSAPRGEHQARVRRVAQVLTAVSALEDEVADQIVGEFELALAVRRAGFPGQPGPGARSPVRSPAVRRRAVVPGSAGPGAGSGRVVRLGRLIPIRGADVGGDVYLLSYAQTASGPQFSLVARTRSQPGSAPARRWLEIPLLEQFTATDDQGTRYRMSVSDLGGGPDGWTLMLDPRPPHDPRWLDLTTTPGEPAARIDLTLPSDTATVTASQATAGPGEHLLHAVAARLLAEAAAPQPGSPPAGAHGLGDIIAALQAAGALSALNPLPGELAALCARLDLAGHGITEPPARDLPEPWLSMLAHYQRRKTRAAPARDGCAAVAAVLAELDGITLAILGLHNSAGSTVLHIHASGPMCDVSYASDELYYWPVIWIRDSGGRWHTTRTRGRSGMNGEVALRLEVIPPLTRATAWIEVSAAGRSAQARATLPLRWE